MIYVNVPESNIMSERYNIYFYSTFSPLPMKCLPFTLLLRLILLKTFKVKEASSVDGTKLRGIGAKVVFTDTTILCVAQRPT